MNLLIIEDDIFLANKIKTIFKKNILSNRIKIISNYKKFLYELYMINSYDIILVDILLGNNLDKNGIDIIKQIRLKNMYIPIVIISGLNDIGWIREGFKYGANDYICKPFRLAELEIRVGKWFNKFLLSNKNVYSDFLIYKSLKYDFNKNIFLVNEKEIFLNKTNKYILLLFLSKSEKLLTDIYLIEKLWGDSNLVDRNIRIVISRLKKSLEIYGINNWISNIRGEGYILKI